MHFYACQAIRNRPGTFWKSARVRDHDSSWSDMYMCPLIPVEDILSICCDL
jgi:hypothetical protein